MLHQQDASHLQQDASYLRQDDASPFDDCIHLDHEVTFFVPSTNGPDVEDLQLAQEMLDYLEEELSKAYGGATQVAPAKGSWFSQNVGLVREKVTPVTVYVAELDSSVKAHLFSLVREIKSTMHQESVLLVVDGKGRLF